MQNFSIDTADISSILKQGEVNFSKSNTKLDSCKTYHVEGIVNERNITLQIENCDSIAKVYGIESNQ